MRILDRQMARLDLASESLNFIDVNTIKAVVDIKREIIAVDSPMHYDCEQLLLEDGSK